MTSTTVGELVERVARAMEPEAWEAHDGKRRDLIKHIVVRSRSLRNATAAIEATGISSLQKEIDAKTAALKRAAFIFRTYAEMHRAKKTDEGDAKAASNEVIAEEMEAALSNTGGHNG